MIFLFRLIFIFIFLLCLAISSALFASALLKPVSMTQPVKNVGGIVTTVKYTNTASNQASFFQKTVSISKTSIGTALKRRASSPWSFAAIAAITAAGLVIGENGDFEEDASPIPYGANFKWFYRRGTATNKYTNDALPESELCDWVAAKEYQTDGSYTWDCVSPANGTTFVLRINYTMQEPQQFTYYYGKQYTTQYNCPTGYTNNGTECIPPTVTVTDEEASNLVFPSLSENQILDLLIDPETGMPDQQVQEISDAATDLANDIDALEDTDPNNDPEVIPEEIPQSVAEQSLLQSMLSQLTQINSNTTPSTDGEEDQDQDECDQYPDRLSCIETGELPTEPEVGTYDVPFSVTPYSLASSASCPEPYSFGTSKGSFTISYQPICDLAIGVNPVVQALGLLLAIGIVGGVVRNGA